MKTIVAPTDFSPVSVNAVNYAADLAVALKAELLIVNVVQIPVSVAEAPLTDFAWEEMKKEAEDELSVLRVHQLSRTAHKVHVSTKILSGSVKAELKQLSLHKEPFALVMGTKGAGAAELFFVGSNTLYAVAHLKCPVFVIPENVSFNG